MDSLYGFLTYMISTLIGLAEVLIVIVPILLAVAFMTLIERKVLAGIQRRVGPNVVGVYGVLQPFADALKLLTKEIVIPVHANHTLFVLAPILTLIFSILGWAIVPFGPGLVIADLELGILYTLALSSIGVYGVLLTGWAANSSYAFLGGLRSTAQIISYELILGTSVLTVILLAGTFNYTSLVESQQAIWYIVPLLPVWILFSFSAVCELNRAPADLPEAESELVAGFFTEAGAGVFVSSFLGEYVNIVFISVMIAILFLGGYGMPELFYNNTFISLASIVLGLKACIGCWIIVWIRATLPRISWMILITGAWSYILPLSIGLVLLAPSILVAFDSVV